MTPSNTARSPVILGIGTATPPHAISQASAGSMAGAFGRYTPRQQRLLQALYRRAQVRTRGSVLLATADGGDPQQTFFAPAQDAADRGPTTAARLERYAREAPVLAGMAADRALNAAGVSARDITHVVTVSCTGFVAPGIDVRLITALGLRPDVERTQVGFMGCHGALNGLRVAAAQAARHAEARVLLCAVELCSLHFRYGWHEDGLVANSLFADGAAACVVGPSPAGPGGGLAIAANGSILLPDSERAMGWRIGDHGFEMRLDATVPDVVGQRLHDWLEQWLRRHGQSIAGIGSWAIHPGGPRLLSRVVAGLGLPDDSVAMSRQVLAEHGNMSSPTVLFILDRLARRAAPRPYVALAFGPGLSVEAALLV
jgi:predicted naringenin-chalcone synthase